ncbi:MAG: PQQ-binding-like beta-propeller repeat protein [Candidatus Marinimicrobia bacterium]|nr:PQQ-binding-like beta-propeller repeat protein [Candidatus Neomarinimicrobiota bacterium]MCF7880230.1 PQQ-binding-like beta-propeller repeat protein [Candidatus Neomarinimicrobiota bacterium]
MRVYFSIMLLASLVLATCTSPIYLSDVQPSSPESPAFHSNKLDKTRLRDMSIGDPVILDPVTTAWLSTRGEIFVLDHKKQKVISHYEGKEGITSFTHRSTSFYWIEEEKEQNLVRYDFEQVETLWRAPAPESTTQPLIVDTMVVVAGIHGTIGAYSIETGKEIWKISVEDRIYLNPLQYGQSILLIGDSGVIFALNSSDGSIEWKKNTGESFQVASISGDVLYCGTLDGAMTRFRIPDREFSWRVQTKYPVRNAPFIDNERVYWVNAGGEVYQIDKTGGAADQLISLETPVSGKPARTEQGLLFAGMDGTLYHVNYSDGGFLDTLKFSGRLRCTPFFMNDKWYVTMEDYWLYALE